MCRSSSICITTRNLPSHVRPQTADRHVAAIAMDLVQERLPSGGKLTVNPLAYLDTPIQHGYHMQRCYLVPKLLALDDVSSGDDCEPALRRSRSCNDAVDWAPHTGQA